MLLPLIERHEAIRQRLHEAHKSIAGPACTAWSNGIFNRVWIDDEQTYLDRCRDFSLGSACHGRTLDDDTEQLRTEGDHGCLEGEIKAKGMVVFARIDHAAEAAEAGLSLRPTEVLIFGNAKAGTPLMQANQAIGVDLPLKALVWQDAHGKVWLSSMSRAGSRSATDWRPQRRRRSTPWWP